MKQTLKVTAAIIGVIAAGLLFWAAVITFLYACEAAGIPM